MGQIVLLTGIMAAATTVRAVIFAATDDPAYNTTEPTGPLAGSGWQYHGQWGGFLGVAVSPHHFITARHIGGAIGDAFSFHGTNYLTVSVASNGTELNVWTVVGELPIFATLYHGPSEPGQAVVIFGRGTRRGAEVFANGQTKGWQWGAADGVVRWGENKVAGQLGALLKFTFDRDAGPNEVHLSSGDSGGGIFVNDGGGWRLAAINYAVEGPWKLTSTSTVFHAALVDRGGVFRGNTTYPESDADDPSAFYATPIAPNAGWLTTELELSRPLPPAGFNLAGPGASSSAPSAAEPSPGGERLLQEKARAGAKPAPEGLIVSGIRTGQ